MLEEELGPLMQIHERKISRQDGASFQRSKVVSKFLGKRKIKELEWSGNSTDLNPIENL